MSHQIGKNEIRLILTLNVTVIFFNSYLPMFPNIHVIEKYT